jgi:hypothetical protein
MTHYVLIDGVLQKSSAATQDWARRASKAVPSTEAELAEDCKKVAECDQIIGVHRSNYQILEELDEIPE